MISEKVREAFEDQINRELYSAYLYQAMASYCEAANYGGFAHWLDEQAVEEREHASRFINHLHERGCQVRYGAIQAPPRDFRSMEDVFAQALAHEEELGAAINSLYDLALTERDYPAQVLLQWFVTEQVEEVAITSEMLENIRRVGDSQQGMFLLDRDAAGRSGDGGGQEA